MDFSAFRNKSVLRLFAAQLLSQICDKLMLVGVIWVISAQHAASWAPWFVAVGALPHLLLTRASPGLIARFGALRIVIATDAARGVVLLAAFAFFVTKGGNLSPSLSLALFGLNVFINCLAAAFNPAILVLPTRITHDPELARKATALVETCLSLSSVTAPMLSVVAFAAFGLPGLLAIGGVSYLAATALELGITELPDENTQGNSPLLSADHPVSLRSIGSRDPLIAQLLFGFLAINLFLGPILAFIPLYARHVYLGNLATVASLETSLGVGTLLGSFALAIASGANASLRRIGSLLLLVAAAYFGFTLSGSAAAGIASLALLGTALASANVLILGLFQSRPEPRELPVVMSWVNLISVASLPISMGIAGALLERLGDSSLRTVAIGAASACLATVMLLIASWTLLSQTRLQRETA